MNTIDNEALLERLHWRYATKQFDPSRKIDAQTWETLQKALILSPSSAGLQPWKFVVVNDPAVRAKLREVAWNQPQVTDASHLVVFAAVANLDVAYVDRFIARAAEVRGVTPESLKGFRDMIVGALGRGFEWSARQAYIALGTLLSSAALLGVDACPMEGFDPAQFDEILGLDKQGYKSVVIAAVGYRSADDKYASLAKVRFPQSEVLQTIG